jgi:TetR/AcrR family transcriptional regulator, acrAB operon repressor
MGRKTKVQAADTRERLLDAAEEVFRAHGVANTSLTLVAAAAGVTRGAVYWHFKNKADLLSAMCARTPLPLDAMLDPGSPLTHEDPLAAIRARVVAALAHLGDDPRTQAVFEVVFHKTERSGDMAGLAAQQERDRSHCQAGIEAMLEQAVRIGQLPSDTDTALAAQLLHACTSGVMRDWVLDKAAYDLAARAPCLVDSLLAGLVANPPRRRQRVRPRVRPRANMV